MNRFDVSQMDAHFRRFGQPVLPVLVKAEIGVLRMKPIGSGVILESKTVKPIECLHYAMNLPASVNCSKPTSASTPPRTIRKGLVDENPEPTLPLAPSLIGYIG